MLVWCIANCIFNRCVFYADCSTSGTWTFGIWSCYIKEGVSSRCPTNSHFIKLVLPNYRLGFYCDATTICMITITCITNIEFKASVHFLWFRIVDNTTFWNIETVTARFDSIPRTREYLCLAFGADPIVSYGHGYEWYLCPVICYLLDDRWWCSRIPHIFELLAVIY